MCYQDDMCRGDGPAAHDVEVSDLQFVPLAEVESGWIGGVAIDRPLTPLDLLLLREQCVEELARERIRRWWYDPAPRAKHCSDCGERFVDSFSRQRLFYCPRCMATREEQKTARAVNASSALSTKYCWECGTQFVDASAGQNEFRCTACTSARAVVGASGTKHCSDCGASFPDLTPYQSLHYCDECKRDRRLGHSRWLGSTTRHCTKCGQQFQWVQSGQRKCGACKPVRERFVERHCVRCAKKFCPAGNQRHCGYCTDPLVSRESVDKRFCACCGTQFRPWLYGGNFYCRSCKLLSREYPRFPWMAGML